MKLLIKKCAECGTEAEYPKKQNSDKCVNKKCKSTNLWLIATKEV